MVSYTCTVYVSINLKLFQNFLKATSWISTSRQNRLAMTKLTSCLKQQKPKQQQQKPTNKMYETMVLKTWVSSRKGEWSLRHRKQLLQLLAWGEFLGCGTRIGNAGGTWQPSVIEGMEWESRDARQLEFAEQRT